YPFMAKSASRKIPKSRRAFPIIKPRFVANYKRRVWGGIEER
ncbi:hypothetical protein CEXT_76031, partial [Caerostris extrusa]